MSTVTEAARTYSAAGWPVLVIRRGEKAPAARDWTTEASPVSDFTDDVNIGVRLGAGLADVDLDAPEALVVGKMLLPTNTRVHGRSGKPSSHYWFQIDPKLERYDVYTDLDGKTVLAELRAKSTHQTVLPPSIHPSGDGLLWENDHALLYAELTDLHLMVRNVAIAAVLSRHWPLGSRHACAGHVAGMLSRLGVDPGTIPRMVRAIAIAAHDDEPNDRERAARDTVDKIARGETKVTGGPALAKLLGEDGPALLSRIHTWCGRDDFTEVDKLNAKHFVVQMGKDIVVGTEPTTPNGRAQFMTPTSFGHLYGNRWVGKTKLGAFWLGHANRRQHDRVVFAPPPLVAGPNDYNLWRGFAYEPLEGAWTTGPITRYLEHILEVICDRNQEHFEFVMDLLARTVQAPGVPTGKVLALRGPQGSGKSLFMTGFGSLFGSHYTVVSNRSHVVGNFNGHLSGKVVVFADEALWGGNKQDTGTWKRLVTERTVMVERKGIDAIEEPNCIHLFMASNEEWLAPAGPFERRLVILDVNDEPRTRAYYDALAAEIEAPAFGPTLLTALQQRDISAGRWRGMLDTRALREQQEFSGGAAQQWWAIKLADGYILPGQAKWPTHVVLDDAYAAYLAEMRGLGHRGDLGTRQAFTRRLKKYLPAAAQFTVRHVPVEVPGRYVEILTLPRRVMVIPNLDSCRRCFDGMLRTSNAWLSPDVPTDDLPLVIQEEAAY